MPRKIKDDSDDQDIVFNDLHCPFNDRRWTSYLMRTLKDYDFKNVIMNGDIAECYALSRFLKHPVTLATAKLDDEITYIRKNIFAPIRDLQPDANIVYNPGNHEDRLRKIIWELGVDLQRKMSEIGLDIYNSSVTRNFGDVLGVRDYDILYNTDPIERYAIFRLRNKLNVTHGDYALKWSGTTAKKFALERGGFWMIGHTHRIGMFIHTFSNGDKCFAWENGCLCQNMEYDATPDWQRGFVVLKWDGPKFMIEPKFWI